MDFLNITLTGWAAIIVALSMAILAALMFILGKERAHYVWGIFSVAVAVWAWAFYAVTLADNPETAKFWWKISFAGLILNPFIFFHFVLEFINDARIDRIKSFIIVPLYVVAGVFLIIDLTTNLIIDEVTLLFDEIYYNAPPGALHPYFMMIFVGLVFYAHYLVYREYRKRRSDRLFRQRVGYFFLATFIAYVGGSMNFLPVYGIEVPPITSIAVAVGSGIIAYAILRHRLFDARVVTAQLLTLVLAGLTLFRLIVSGSAQEMVLNGVLLIITLIIGIYLILSVRKEVERREQVEVLAKDLQTANEKLKELDDLKTDFISIASHQLRTPLTAIKGYSSMILEGTYGESPFKIKGAVDKIFQSAQRLIYIVNDLLDVSRIEQGRFSITPEEVKVANVLRDVTEELKPNAAAKNIDLSFETSTDDAEIKMSADFNKIRQVFTNLVDNSVKYTNTGYVKVMLGLKDGNALVSVKDSGIGISPTTMQNLFQKFSRAKGVSKLHTDGSGLGLYVAREIVAAHGGKVWAESEGVGKGSQFYVSLPIKNPNVEEIEQFVSGM